MIDSPPGDFVLKRRIKFSMIKDFDFLFNGWILSVAKRYEFYFFVVELKNPVFFWALDVAKVRPDD